MPDINYFQGIGTLYGNVNNNEELGWYLPLFEHKYRLFVPPNKYRAWLTQMEINRNLYLTVYPRSFIVPKQPPKIYFQVTAWGTEPSNLSKPGFFILRGIWQKIPQLQYPCISIYRNKSAEDPTDRYKCIHVPTIMKRSDCSPYKFNANTPKDEIKKYFIQGEFKFVPKVNAFGFQKDLSEPTLEIPGYKINKDKLEANVKKRKSLAE